MASPKGLAERSAPLLPPGSRVRHAFICQTAPNFAYFLINWATGLTMLWITYRCVAFTEEAIYVSKAETSHGDEDARTQPDRPDDEDLHARSA